MISLLLPAAAGCQAAAAAAVSDFLRFTGHPIRQEQEHEHEVKVKIYTYTRNIPQESSKLHIPATSHKNQVNSLYMYKLKISLPSAKIKAHYSDVCCTECAEVLWAMVRGAEYRYRTRGGRLRGCC